MRLATALLALGLLGCQAAPPPPPAAAPAPVASQPPMEKTRRTLARLNPRRQSLEVGEAPPAAVPRRLPMKVGVRVIPEPVQQPRLVDERTQQVQRLNDSLRAEHQQVRQQNEITLSQQQLQREQIERQNQAILGQYQQQHEQILRQNEALMSQQQQQRERVERQNQTLWESRPLPGQGLTPQMQQVAYPQVGASQAHRAAEQRYLEARADFLNTKYVPPGSPPRFSAESVRGEVGTGMPLPPQMITQPAMFNPVLQKAQQTEILRQEMVRTP